jgi:hypothetical protein
VNVDQIDIQRPRGATWALEDAAIGSRILVVRKPAWL